MTQHPSTDNHGYPVMSEGSHEDEWGGILNTELIEPLDVDTVVRTTDANMSDFTPHNTALLYTTDTGKFYEGDGTSWNETQLEARLSNHFSAGNPHSDSASLSDTFSGSHTDLTNVGTDDHHSQSHGNADHTEVYIADGDGVSRDYWVIANGASDPSGAANNDLIFEEEA